MGQIYWRLQYIIRDVNMHAIFLYQNECPSLSTNFPHSIQMNRPFSSTERNLVDIRASIAHIVHTEVPRVVANVLHPAISLLDYPTDRKT
jgi:hypothetical protein